jgi:protoheme IX farnesyltransferase
MRRQPDDTNALSDLIVLTKPTITAQCALMVIGGLWLAPDKVGLLVASMAVLGTSLAVASANALNMVLERDGDRHMTRTKNRPLPTGRMRTETALVFGLALGALSMALLGAFVNGLTALLGALALASYVLVYTPLKRRTPLALLIGAFPGAAPPLMGWTAATGGLEAPGLVLFAILLLWQMPHFLAISMYRKKEYAEAGIRVVPVVRGDAIAKAQAIAYATALVPVSLLLVPLGVAGWLYAAVALAGGLWLLGLSVHGLRVPRTAKWARDLFLATLVYLPALTVALIVDVWLR